jgi:DNA mismatch repair ATPase MutS
VHLQSIFDSIEKTVAFIRKNPFEADKIESYFRNIDLVNSLDKAIFDTSDIFLIKKFLICFKAILSQLNEEMKVDHKLEFSLQEILDLLTPDGGTGFIFHLDSSYDNQLKVVRDKINKLDKKILDIKSRRLTELYNLYELDFKYRDFLIVDEANASKYSNDLIYKEVYDSSALYIKPIFPPHYFEMYQQKDALLAEEHLLEQKVLERLSTEILKKKDVITEYIQKVETLDILFAKAQLALKYSMVKPTLNSVTKFIEIINGRFLPLMNRCKEIDTVYTPLTASFDSRIVVVTGSNMGGKTVLLKTIGFLQLLAQMGFWIPADAMKTSVFENISYIGNEENDNITGLSSFGFEIHKLTNVLKQLEKPTFLLIDEFAKTTNSTEAKALISALLMSFSQKETLHCFLSTHFMELPDFIGVSFYKMKGFSQSAYKKLYVKNIQLTLNERIRLINSFMQYEVVKNENSDKSNDAIMIADILGLDEEIIAYAKNYLGGNYG